MCDETRTLVQGVAAADELLSVGFGVTSVEKALDPLDPADFVTIIGRLTVAVSESVAGYEAAAVKRAMNALDVDWKNLTAAQREAVVLAGKRALPGPKGVVTRAMPVFSGDAAQIVAQTKSSAVRKFGLKIGVQLNAADKAVAKFVRTSQANYLTDHTKQRLDTFSERARKIVGDGMERGLGSADIVTDLDKALGPASAFGRNSGYYRVIATTFAGRARGFELLNSFSEAAIEQFMFEAVMDERTTLQCRFLHGQVFSVPAAQALYQRVEADPDSVRDVMPWIQVGKDANNNRELYVKDSVSGTRKHVARVVQDARGTSDKRGSFSTPHNSASLSALGVPVPPVHGLCRSTLVPA